MNKNLIDSIKCNLDLNCFIGRWYNNKSNWGDAINPILIKGLYGVNLVHENTVINIFDKPVYSIVGSIINVFRKNNHIIICGSGVADPTIPLSYKPEKVYSIRGPRTYKYLKENSISAPSIFGDPVLLMKNIYKPIENSKKYKLGVILHYADQLPELMKLCNNNNDILFINIIQDMKNPFRIIEEIVACEYIISSSLHGLILADLYEIPNSWVFFKGFEKGTFKFYDYYESIKAKVVEPTILTDDGDTNKLFSLDFDVRPINLDLKALYQSSPFIN